MMSEIGSGFGKGKEKSSNNNNNNYSVYGKNMTVRGANELDMVVEGKSILKQRPNVSPYRYSSSLHNRHEFSELEKAELLDYPNVYYSGQNSRRKRESLAEYDDSRGDYVTQKGDHIAFRFEVLEVLGKGSFGRVLSCKDHANGQNVAIKIIRNKKRFHQQALIEVQILEKLKAADPSDHHPFIKIDHSFLFRNHLCIVFPLLSINLYEFIKQNNFAGFSLGLIRRITSQIVDCLVLLARLDIIHCDLKPENILLEQPTASAVKVIDFGSSCYSNERIYTYIQSRFYRSPEIILGLEYGPAIDMWSLGCILAELFTGYPLFPAEDEQELMACFLELLGEPPAHLVELSSRRKIFFHSDGSPKLVPSSKGKLRNINAKTLEQVLKPAISNDPMYWNFIDFIKKCLVWDSPKRMTPFEAKRHPFIGIEGKMADLKLNSPKKTYQLQSTKTAGTIKRLSQEVNVTGGLVGSERPLLKPTYKNKWNVPTTEAQPNTTSVWGGAGSLFNKLIKGVKNLTSSRESLVNNSELESVTVDETSNLMPWKG